jgi:quinol monooxygenase YgiN
MADIAVIAKLTAQPGKRADLAAALQGALDTAAGEPGTIYYILTEDAVEADLLWMFEMYTDQAALDSHMGSDAFKALGPAIGPFLGGRPELTFLKPIGGKGA